jgi:hypothetical protein
VAEKRTFVALSVCTTLGEVLAIHAPCNSPQRDATP